MDATCEFVWPGKLFVNDKVSDTRMYVPPIYESSFALCAPYGGPTTIIPPKLRVIYDRVMLQGLLRKFLPVVRGWIGSFSRYFD